MLESYGIETAADVSYQKIIHIPGFGEALTSELVKWRRRHEQNFRFNPNEPTDPRDITALDQELEAQRQSLLTTLRQGPETLRRLNQEIGAARSRLMPIMEKTWNSHKDSGGKAECYLNTAPTPTEKLQLAVPTWTK